MICYVINSSIPAENDILLVSEDKVYEISRSTATVTNVCDKTEYAVDMLDDGGLDGYSKAKFTPLAAKAAMEKLSTNNA